MCKYSKGGRDLVKPYVIIKGSSANPYSPLQREKLPYVIYERSLILLFVPSDFDEIAIYLILPQSD